MLVGDAEALGVTLRITGEPLKPLAMGNQRHVIDARAARHGAPQGVQVGSPLKVEPVPHIDRWAGATPLQPRTKSG
jgi:hypothetical protein